VEVTATDTEVVVAVPEVSNTLVVAAPWYSMNVAAPIVLGLKLTMIEVILPGLFT
jgi:hypothetical protein